MVQFVASRPGPCAEDRLVEHDPDAATTALFGLHLSGDWATARDLLPPDDASPGVRASPGVAQAGLYRVASLRERG